MAEEMIGFCGITCTKCEAYLATQTNDEERAKKTAAMWSKQFQINVKLEDVWCDGCLVEGKKCAHCGECEFRACGQTKGVANCAHCDEYPCEPLAGFFKMVPDAQKTLDSVRAMR